MNLHLELPQSVEDELRARAAAGLDIDAFVAEAVMEKLAEIAETPATESPRPKTHEEFAARLRRVAGRHRGPGDAIDDSRESIYAGRGE